MAQLLDTSIRGDLTVNGDVLRNNQKILKNIYVAVFQTATEMTLYNTKNASTYISTTDYSNSSELKFAGTERMYTYQTGTNTGPGFAIGSAPVTLIRFTNFDSPGK